MVECQKERMSEKEQNRMRGREITEFGHLGCHVAELYSPSLTLTWGGNYQNPLVLRQDEDYKALSLFLHAVTRWNWLTRWMASLWLQVLICLDSMGWIEG